MTPRTCRAVSCLGLVALCLTLGESGHAAAAGGGTPPPASPTPAPPALPPASPVNPSPPTNPAVPPQPPAPPPHSGVLDRCKRFGCHPKITAHAPAKSFGEGMNLTLTGVDFGNFKGKIQMTNGGVTVDLPIVTWTQTQIVAGYQAVIGVPGGAAQVWVTTTDGTASNQESVVFKALYLPIHLPAVVMRVDSCSKGTSDNQCNGQHLGEGDLQQFAYKDPPAVVGHHYDNCNAVCFGGPTGTDTYSVGPLKNGFTMSNFRVRLTKCGYREKSNGSWNDFGPNSDTCKVIIKKQNIEDDRGTFAISWTGYPQADLEYAADIDVIGPAGMNPL